MIVDDLSVKIKNNNVPSFGSKKIFSVCLKKIAPNMEESFQDAFVSLLNKEDVPVVEQSKHVWNNTLGGGIITNFLDAFKDIGGAYSKYQDCLKNYKFFAVENPVEKDGNKRIIGLISMYPDGKSLVVDKLQTVNGLPGEEKIKGAGSVLMYAASRVAEAMGKNKLWLRSAQEKKTLDFYSGIGMSKITSSYNNFFELFADNFSNFQSKIAKKCKLKALCNLDWEI